MICEALLHQREALQERADTSPELYPVGHIILGQMCTLCSAIPDFIVDDDRRVLLSEIHGYCRAAHTDQDSLA